MSTTSPSLLSSAASPASSSHQNGRPFSISSLLHSSQNFEPKYPPLGTAAAFSDALQQCLPMLFAARGIIGEGTTAGIGAAQFSNVFQPKLMGKERTKEEEKEENGEEADEVPTSEESSQSEDDGTMGKGIEEKMEMKEEEEELEKSELNMNKEQKQMKAEGEEEEADKIKEKEDKGGITPEGCFVPWLFPVLPPLPAHHHHHQQPPSLPLPSPTTGGRCPPLFPAPFIPAFLKSPFSLPAQFLLSAGTFPTVCGPCAPQSAQQQQHNQNNHNHQQQQQHNSGHHHQHKRKGGQIRFSNEQTDILESTFEVRKYLNNMERKRLARALELHERQVKTWFQNRRAKWRRQTPAVTENSREGEESISETVGGTAMAAAEQHNQQQHHHHAFELYMQRQ